MEPTHPFDTEQAAREWAMGNSDADLFAHSPGSRPRNHMSGGPRSVRMVSPIGAVRCYKQHEPLMPSLR
jgi:hypothetical protein